MTFAASAGNAPYRRNIDYASALAFYHISYCPFGTVENAFYVNAENAFPFLIGAILKKPEQRDPRVVDKYGNFAQLCLYFFKHCADFSVIRNVRFICPAADFLGKGSGFFFAFFKIHRNGISFGGEFFAYGFSNAAASAGDKNDLCQKNASF